MSIILDQILDNNPGSEYILVDGYDAAVIGVAYGSERLVYDVHVMIAIMMEEEMTEEDAWEHFSFNIGSAYVGSNTPIFLIM